MTRNELKTTFLQMDLSNVKEKKQIIVETNYGHVEIVSEGPNGYNSFKTNQGKGDTCVDYGIYQKLEKPEYELIVDGTIIK